MRVTEPTLITPDKVISSSLGAVSGNDPAAWVSGTAYSPLDRVSRPTTGRIYVFTGGTVNTATPPEELIGAGWKDDGPTNRMAMFALDRNTASVSSSNLSVTVAPGSRISTVGLFGLRGHKATITVAQGEETVLTREFGLIRRDTTTWSEYFFGSLDAAQVRSVITFDVPPVTGARVTVTVEGSGETALASLVVGTSHYIGDMQYDAVSDTLNFSKIDRSPIDGTATLLPRRNVPKVEGVVEAPAHLTPVVLSLRKRLDARPAVWSGLDDRIDHPYFEPVLLVGVYKRWSIALPYNDVFHQQLEIEEI